MESADFRITCGLFPGDPFDFLATEATSPNIFIPHPSIVIVSEAGSSPWETMTPSVLTVTPGTCVLVQEIVIFPPR